MKSAFVFTAAALAMMGAASANVITIDGGPATITCNGMEANVCEAITGGSLVVMNPGNEVKSGMSGSFSGSSADLYDIGNAGPDNETKAFNTLGGLSLMASDAMKSVSNPMASFKTVAEYFLMKIGNSTFFIHNTTGGEIEVVYEKNGATGAGLSHYTLFGDTPEVPLPGAIWLMGAGLAGLGFAGRRKTAA